MEEQEEQRPQPSQSRTPDATSRNRPKRDAKKRTPRYRDINEDDDGYHPYSDRQETPPLFERDPWV